MTDIKYINDLRTGERLPVKEFVKRETKRIFTEQVEMLKTMFYDGDEEDRQYAINELSDKGNVIKCILDEVKNHFGRKGINLDADFYVCMLIANLYDTDEEINEEILLEVLDN